MTFKESAYNWALSEQEAYGPYRSAAYRSAAEQSSRGNYYVINNGSFVVLRGYFKI